MGQRAILRNFDFRTIDALAEMHRRIRAPVLAIWGESDPFFPLQKARQMIPQFGGGAELVVIPRAKLYAHEDHPEEFANLAMPFLSRTCEEASSSISTKQESKSAHSV
jgi:pimeloyl-ACP methyl ester carboxylesterase